ncbi:MAG TPA: molybdopterin molybdotransferase MoeA [Novosphingobium sp.]|nr:molybdopterin molybdotransferase MoeA [Novosphingobium sp.]
MTPPLALDEAQARLLALAPSLPIEPRAVEDCAGFYLTEPLVARRTQPAAAMSAMDGYAVRSGDPGPWRVIGESAAGRPFPTALGASEAARISTGALLPEGADTILIQEDCRREGDRLAHDSAPPPAGRHVRRAGLDFDLGAELLAAGIRIGPAQLALAIAAGHHELAVRRRVRLAVIDCGDELCPAGAAVEPHQLPASNGPMLAAMVAALPCDVTRIGPLLDRLDALAGALDATRDADVVVISGGASVGDHDLVRPALAEVGAELDFWRVAIKPGKPLLVARRGRQVIVGLPGNPASAYVTAFLFVLPLLRAALGAAKPWPLPIPARLAAPLPAGGRRIEFLRGRAEQGHVAPEAAQDSGGLLSLARANALIRREIEAPVAAPGDIVEVFLLE